MHLFEQKIINISDIQVLDRARKDMGEITVLADSMEEVGIITPIAVKAIAPDLMGTPDKLYTLLAGERRLRSCKQRGDTVIPACIFPHDLSPRLARQIELFENVKRQAFTPAEEAQLTKDLHDAMILEHGEARTRGNAAEGIEGWRMKDTADFLGVSIAKVSGDLDIAQAVALIPSLKNATTRSQITKTVNKILKEAVKAESAAKVAATQPTEMIDKRTRLINSFIIMDFFSLAEKIAPGSIHFNEVDPPYGIGLDDTKDQPVQLANTDYHEVAETDYPVFMKRLCETLWRVSASDSFTILWHDPAWEDMTKAALQEAGFRVKRTKGIWIKDEASNKAPDWNLSQYYEQFWVATKGSPKLMQSGRSALFEFPCVPTHSKIHRTERPMALIEELIETFTPPDARILVPFLGSGKTLLAAANKKRTAIGCELSSGFKDIFTRMVNEQVYGMFTDNE